MRYSSIANMDVPNASNEWARAYRLWNSMINRCYNNPRDCYKDVKVCERWLRFSNFLVDLPSIPGYTNWLKFNGYDLDKDILCEKLGIEPKIYSPDTCAFRSAYENRSYISKRKASNTQNQMWRITSLVTGNVEVLSTRDIYDKYGTVYATLNKYSQNGGHPKSWLVKIEKLDTV